MNGALAVYFLSLPLPFQAGPLGFADSVGVDAPDTALTRNSRMKISLFVSQVQMDNREYSHGL
jgi:hypothetical protein